MAGRTSRRRWQILEEVLAAKRRRNDRLPIFLFGNELTAEMVPASVLKHANAFMRLFEDSPEFIARVICRAAQLYLERLPPPMFKALMDYTLHASYSWHTPGHGGGVAFRKSPVGQLFYQFFGENTLRSDVSVSVGMLGSLLDHTGPIAAGERNAARIFGADETLFVVGGTSTANKIVWHGTVVSWRSRPVRPQLSQVDPALSDHDGRDADLSRAFAQRPGHHRTDIAGPIHAESIRKKIAASPFAKETSGKVRLMVMTNSTYDGLCYNIDAIKADHRRCRRCAALRRSVVRLRQFPRVLRRLSRHLIRTVPRDRRKPSPSPPIRHTNSSPPCRRRP